MTEQKDNVFVEIQYVINPKTGKKIKKTGRLYKKLLKEGVFDKETLKEPELEELEEKEEDEEIEEEKEEEEEIEEEKEEVTQDNNIEKEVLYKLIKRLGHQIDNLNEKAARKLIDKELDKVLSEVL